MINLENKQISFNANGGLIIGTVNGSNEEWEFVSDSPKFIEVYSSGIMRSVSNISSNDMDEINTKIKKIVKDLLQP